MNSKLLKVAMCLMLVGGAVNIQNVESMEKPEENMDPNKNNKQEFNEFNGQKLDNQQRNEDIEEQQYNDDFEDPQYEGNNINIIMGNNTLDLNTLDARIAELRKKFSAINETASTQTNMDDMTNMNKINPVQKLHKNVKVSKLSLEERVRKNYGLTPVMQGEHDSYKEYFNYFQMFDAPQYGAFSLESFKRGYINFRDQYDAEITRHEQTKHKQQESYNAVQELQKEIAQLTGKMRERGFIFEKNNQLKQNQDLEQVAALRFHQQFNYVYNPDAADEKQTAEYNKIYDEVSDMQNQMQDLNNELNSAVRQAELDLNYYESSKKTTIKARNLLYEMLSQLQARSQKTYTKLIEMLNSYTTKQKTVNKCFDDVNNELASVKKSLKKEKTKFDKTNRTLTTKLQEARQGEQDNVQVMQLQVEIDQAKLQYEKKIKELRETENVLSQEVTILEKIITEEYDPINKLIDGPDSNISTYLKLYEDIGNRLAEHAKAEKTRKIYAMQKQAQKTQPKKNNLTSTQVQYNNIQKTGNASISLQKMPFGSPNNLISGVSNTNKAGFNVTKALQMPNNETSQEGTIQFDMKAMNDQFQNNKNELQINPLSNSGMVIKKENIVIKENNENKEIEPSKRKEIDPNKKDDKKTDNELIAKAIENEELVQ